MSSPAFFLRSSSVSQEHNVFELRVLARAGDGSLVALFAANAVAVAFFDLAASLFVFLLVFLFIFFVVPFFVLISMLLLRFCSCHRYVSRHPTGKKRIILKIKLNQNGGYSTQKGRKHRTRMYAETRMNQLSGHL